MAHTHRQRLGAKDNRQPWLVNLIEAPIFGSRWVQAPLYFGLIIAQGVYVYKFLLELWHLVSEARTLLETQVMLMVLGLIDVVMVANLLMMVIVGGYEAFVSRLYIEDHPDKPEWFDHVDAGVLKVKLATAMVTISSIHLLKSFIDIEHVSQSVIFSQIAIHGAFLVSVLTLAYVERMMHKEPCSEPH